MNNKLKQFYNDSRDSLSDDAHVRIKKDIFSKLDYRLPAVASVSLMDKVSNMLFRSYVIAPLALVLFITGTTITSAHSLPGDKLYSVKRKIENARLLIAPSEDAKLELEANFAQNRLEEAEKMETNDQAEIELEATAPEDTTATKQSPPAENSLNNSDPKSSDESEHALEVLNRVKKNFEEKGKTKQAEQIDNNIKRFEENREKRQDRQENRVRERASSTINSREETSKINQPIND
jgi:Domain of unknown function (DUF5667)